MKKICLILSVFLILGLTACSKESKFGVQEFCGRMNTQFETELDTALFSLATHENGEQFLVSENDEMLIFLALNSDQKIKGVGLVLTEDYDIAKGISTFAQSCAVFTNTSIDEQKATLLNCGITAEGIKYADSSFYITVDKYKYSIVCSEFGVSLFCDRI